MSQWEQHYYTWSTNSLSGNKVGLGIVAASVEDDRDYMRVMENQGARSEVCRDEESLTIERMSYNEELHAYIRSGATPCASGADKRNNKFVHLYSRQEEDNLLPEDYLSPLSFQKQWNGEQELSPVTDREAQKDRGRKNALKVLDHYGLRDRLPELFYSVYHCLLTGDKPLSLVDSEKSPEEFGEFSRQMMVLIHYMLPSFLRKEADYVSYVKEDSQEAHFLFRKEGGSYVFDVHAASGRTKEYALLEQEFYQKLSDSFLKKDDSFEGLMRELDRFLQNLADKRNQLEKCVFAFMASEASKAKNKEAFFTGIERLMYWARKDKSLIPALHEATKDLDFHSMEEEELLSYTSLLLTGAGGGTKEMAYGELNRMLAYYYRTQDKRFDLILDRICKKNHTVYEQILKENEKDNGFTKMILYQPIENKVQLADAIRNHESFLEEEDYRYYVAQSAYSLYQKTKSREGREEIAGYGKKADRDVFVKLKQKDVEKVLNSAGDLAAYFQIVDQLEIEELEEPIRRMIYESAISRFEKAYPKLTEEYHPLKRKTSRGKAAKSSHKDDVRKLLFLAEKLSYGEEVREKLVEYYERMLRPVIRIMKPEELIHISFWNGDNSNEAAANPGAEESSIYVETLTRLTLNRYLELMKTEQESFLKLSVKDWIRFVLRLTSSQEKGEKKLAREAISKTKEAILKNGDLFLLAEANQVLKNYGVSGISCPKSLWDKKKVQDFGEIYAKIADITLLKCETSPVYLAMEVLYHFAQRMTGREDQRKITVIFKKKEAVGEDLLKAMAALWGKNETLDLEFFYPFLEESFGEEAKELMQEAVKGNAEGESLWKEYEKKHKKEVEKAMRQTEKEHPVKNILRDIMSESLWSVLLGLYGYLFVHSRDMSIFKEEPLPPTWKQWVHFQEMISFKESYSLSVKVLIGLVILYLLVSFFGRKKIKTPGAMVYLAGMSIFLMNLALSLDTQVGVVVLFVVSAGVGLAFKIISLFLYRERE